MDFVILAAALSSFVTVGEAYTAETRDGTIQADWRMFTAPALKERCAQLQSPITLGGTATVTVQIGEQFSIADAKIYAIAEGGDLIPRVPLEVLAMQSDVSVLRPVAPYSALYVAASPGERIFRYRTVCIDGTFAAFDIKVRVAGGD